MKKLTGTIKTIKRAEGFGFITHTETGIDHFFHRRGLEDGSEWDKLEIGQDVEFVDEMNARGPRAVQVARC